MEMLKFLTHKLRAQSLNEVQPFHPEEVDEDHDSGTESDEENIELQAMEEAMPSEEEEFENTENAAPPPLPSIFAATTPPSPASAVHNNTNCSAPAFRTSTPPRSTASPVTSVSLKRPFQLVNHSNNHQCGSFRPPLQSKNPSELTMSPVMLPTSQPSPPALNQDTSSSPQEASSDFERCSLDYEPGSSVEFEQHSSEDELAVINCCKAPEFLPAEKRKWSQMNRCGSCSDSSGSSDEEVRDLFANTGDERGCESRSDGQPLHFSSSPPRGVQHLSQTMSPQFLRSVHCSSSSVTSPRKRHRQANSTDVSNATSIQRPCLDFDKMQKTLLRKHGHSGLSRARVVKIRSINGSSRTPKCEYDPAVFCFRSISVSTGYSPLTPVEEPSCAY